MNYIKYFFIKDRAREYLEGKTKVTRIFIQRNGIMYRVADEVDAREMEFAIKKPCVFFTRGYYRYIKTYDKTLKVKPFQPCKGIYIGNGHEGILKCPLNTEINNFLLVGCSGAGKTNEACNIIKNCLLQEVEVIIADLKGSFDYNCFPCEKYTTVEDCIKCLYRISSLCEKRLKTNFKHKPLLFVIDEVFPFLTLKNKKELYNQLALLLSRCRAVNIHVLICTQRATAEILPTMITANISHRIVLKTASAQESINVLNNSIAFNIHSAGHGYYYENGKLTEFKAPLFEPMDIPQEQSEQMEQKENEPKGFLL